MFMFYVGILVAGAQAVVEVGRGRFMFPFLDNLETKIFVHILGIYEFWVNIWDIWAVLEQGKHIHERNEMKTFTKRYNLLTLKGVWGDRGK